MSQYIIQMLPGSEALLAELSSEMPQKNELCGAFWITLALRAIFPNGIFGKRAQEKV